MAVRRGNNRRNTLRGTSDDDVLYGRGGDDTLYGLDGNDRLYGDGHNDRLYGGDGDDRLTAGSGDDRLYGQGGHDRLIGGAGRNLLHGGGGNDTISSGIDQGRDRLIGGSGDDRLIVRGRNDVAIGGSGDDTYRIGDEQNLIKTRSDPGIDTVMFSGSYTLGPHQENLTINSAYAGPATLRGNSGDNVITGTFNAHRLIGGGGHDTFISSLTQDNIDGGGGTDTVRPYIFEFTFFLFDDDRTPQWRNIEVIDISGSVRQTVHLSPAIVRSITDARNTLRIDGDALDSVTSSTFWSYDTTVRLGDTDYARFTLGTATVLVDTDVNAQLDARIDLGSLSGPDGTRFYQELGNSLAGSTIDFTGNFIGHRTDGIILGEPGINSRGGASVQYRPSGFQRNLNRYYGDDSIGFIGNDHGDLAGTSVAGIGDFNGDGYADIAIGAPQANTVAGVDSGETYVIFGRPRPGSGFAFDALERIDAYGPGDSFVIRGAGAVELSGSAVAGAGDFNRDGLDDLIIGAKWAGDDFEGHAYLVLGSENPPFDFDLDALDGSDGAVFTGGNSGDQAATSVDGGFDFNGDGIDDIVISAPGYGDDGRIYVVFGSTGPMPAMQDLDTIGNGGVIIEGIALENTDGAVSGAGDVNGDGFEDIIIGSPFASGSAGSAFIVYGGNTLAGTTIDLATLDAAGGVRLIGENNGDLAGTSVAGAGDVNADGYADVIVGAPGADPNGVLGAGKAYVLLGGQNLGLNISLESLANSRGFVLESSTFGGGAGTAVAGGGDVNGDGFADLLVGAPYVGGSRGDIYLVYGKDFRGGLTHLGSSFRNDSFTGTNGVDRMVGDDGNDRFNGRGGADVMYGGAGNDSFFYGPGDFRVDGGSGTDRLLITGRGKFVDFTKINNLVYSNIEIVDLRSTGNQSVKLSLEDVLDLSGSSFIRIDGDAGDRVYTADAWTREAGRTRVGSNFYRTYTSEHGSMLIDDDINTAGLQII